MSEHTTFRIGGKAKYYIRPECTDDVIKCIRFLRKSGIRYFVCGRLSNVVFADYGYDGAVVDLRCLQDVSFDGNTVECGAGASVTSLSLSAVKNGLSGLEFAYGIPGTVGGGIYMNAGAYGGQFADVVKSVLAYDPENDRIVSFDSSQCDFSYRHSIFTDSSFIILSCTLCLKNADCERVLAASLENMKKRQDKQPLDKPSAGSVFKRPEGYFVGSMIEELGLKGYSVGGVGISEKHAGFMVNNGGGTCSELRSLISFVKEKVMEKYYVDLQCEIRFVL